MKRSILIYLLVLLSCNPGKTYNRQGLPDEYISRLLAKLSGKKYSGCEGEILGAKTIVFFIDKENVAVKDNIIADILDFSGRFPKDSAELETVVLINPYTDFAKADANKFDICFTDINSMCIKKKIVVNKTGSFENDRKLISQVIIQVLKHR